MGFGRVESDYPEGTNWGVEAINAMEAREHYDEMSYVKLVLLIRCLIRIRRI